MQRADKNGQFQEKIHNNYKPYNTESNLQLMSRFLYIPSLYIYYILVTTKSKKISIAPKNTRL